MTKRQILTLILTAFFLLLGIGIVNSLFTNTQPQPKLLISAAASLKEALEEIKPLYQQVNEQVTLNYNFGASGTLQQQIENGAPADVFFSAAQKQMDNLQQKNLIIPETRRNLLSNSLVLIVPQTSFKITSFNDLTTEKIKRIAIGEPRSVPAGQYATEALKNLGILEQIKPKFVFVNNVRSVLATVESRNADAGIVYTTDAELSNQIKRVATAPANLHAPIVYPIAILKTCKNVTAAQDYVQFLASDRALAIFKKYGFKPVR